MHCPHCGEEIVLTFCGPRDEDDDDDDDDERQGPLNLKFRVGDD